MSQITPTQVVRDHLALDSDVPSQKTRSIAVFAFGLVFAALVGVGVWLLGIETNANGALLTATSIMTGLVFTMTMRFWERSLDARSDPDLLFDAPRRTTIDTMRTMLLWTVFAGIASTAWLAVLALVYGTGSSPAWPTGVSAGLVTYQMFYVVRSLLALYSASYTLRK